MAEHYASPPLSLFHAHILAGIFAVSYVGSLYVSQNTRITYSTRTPGEQARERERRRDDPDVIRARLAAVSLSTVVSWVVLVVVLHNLHPYEVRNAIVWLMMTTELLIHRRGPLPLYMPWIDSVSCAQYAPSYHA